MADRRMFEDDSAAKQRLTGAPSGRQLLVLIGLTAFVSAFALGFVELELETRMVLTAAVMLVLVLIGSAFIGRANLRRRR